MIQGMLTANPNRKATFTLTRNGSITVSVVSRIPPAGRSSTASRVSTKNSPRPVAMSRPSTAYWSRWRSSSRCSTRVMCFSRFVMLFGIPRQV